ncbi:mitochondrial putative choline dehydrogenase [Halenospora varia]|nr:mitochondrial putative choline dehydrogenase [Halenospora varia]
MLRQIAVAACLALGVVANAEVTEYEYIVVGSGPGGGPVAANLARAGHTVLLLEAGDDQTQNVNVSQLMNFNIAANDEKTRWDFFVNHTDDDSAYNHMVYRKPDGATKLGIWYPRTGTLGGCAMHNGAVVSLPADNEWDAIANATGDDGWLTKNMRQHYIRMERNADIAKTDATHGFNGWLDISLGDTSWVNGNADAVALAAKAANLTGASPSQLKALMDRDIDAVEANRDQSTGIYGSWSHATKSGLRSSPGYYVRDTVKDAAKYPLTLQMNSLVTKVIFDTNNTAPKSEPRAIGVEYLRGEYLYGADPRNADGKRKGTPGKAYASKEVIIAGGAFNSPQILMLSGIGPAEELKKFNIPVVVDSPGVGRNLDDNYEGSVASLAARDMQGVSNIFFVFLKTSQSMGNRDVHMWCGQFSFEGFWPGFPDDFGPKQFECTFVHMNPRSQKGWVKLRSADPQDTPEINFKFWEKNADKDLQAMLEAIKFARKVVQDAPPGLGPFKEIHPCTDANPNCTDTETKDFLKKQVYSHHATSTCAIGGDNDKMAVLDSKFRVRGVKGLRVVDASAFPKVPGSFPVIPTIVLSEKASYDILSALKP